MRVPVVGHKQVLSSIPKPLPPSLLLTGPEGVGKRRVAQLLAFASGVKGMDFQNLGVLTREGSRELLQHHSSHPLESAVKTSVADLTGSSPEAVNAILKLLEEPPPYSRIILHSDREPLLTIRSRCFSVRFGVLTEAEVIEVLETLGLPEHTLADSARVSQGRVSLALDFARQYVARKHVRAVLLALQERSGSALDQALSEALEGERGEEMWAVWKRREVAANLFAGSLRNSLIDPTHVLSDRSSEVRTEAIKILESPSRPNLKMRSAAWVLMESL